MKTTTLAALTAALLLTACGSVPERMEAGVAMPDRWSSPQTNTAAFSDATWWQRFGSDELTQLVTQAQANNHDLAAAVARVQQAAASARISGAPLLPALSASLGAEQEKTQNNASTRTYAAGLTASYELDVWGKNSAANAASLATLTATQYARESVALTLTASVVSTYLQTLGLRERAEIARLNLEAAERILAVVVSRERAGMATALELAQQKGLVASQRKNLAQRQQQAQDSLTALAILLGRAPQGFTVQGTSLNGIAVPNMTAGVPSDLLVRRPDLAQAERTLAAANANVAVARRAMLPQLTLTAGVGTSTDQWSDVLRAPIYSLAAGIAAPIFQGGRLRAGKDLALAQREELLSKYRSAIISAFGDVEKALNAISSVAVQRDAQFDALVQAREAVRLAESRYRSGAESLLTVLDTQRTLYSDQDLTAQLTLEQLQASVGLFKALGGGWQMTTTDSPS
jgi:multidrug efflux system outer membrane protein